MMRRLVLATVVLTTTAGFSPVRPRRSLATRANLFRGGEGEAKLHIAGQLFPALRSTVISSERLGVALEKVMVAACFADLAVMGVLYAGAEPVLRVWRRAEIRGFTARDCHGRAVAEKYFIPHRPRACSHIASLLG